MCDPVTASLIIGAATTAGGTIMQMNAQEDARDRANSLRAAADESNNAIIDSTQALQQDAAAAFGEGTFQEDVQGQEDAIRDRLLDNLVSGFAGVDFAETPEIVRRSDAREQEGAQEFAAGFADALARLRGFDQNLFNQNLNIGRVGEATQTNSGFIQGNANALNSDLQMIDASSPFGDALVAFGGTALSAGAGGLGPENMAGQSSGFNPAKAAPGRKPPIPARFS